MLPLISEVSFLKYLNFAISVLIHTFILGYIPLCLHDLSKMVLKSSCLQASIIKFFKPFMLTKDLTKNKTAALSP
ncbi:hypothetical protein HRM2_16050 [Desulforapulum autotrophicum HRM2]|uniref:Uncharacterized protein n=1 Tax=Desulforapulum autotrophicum (strain ATCC 43914 / DSM 3382 / VKM B-1955 / HRM2) TaxID=177437 RepID=C0QAC9_DESAH|nr:hypothetical protein HRM2_16050 [Desulforapulum autotrophicum HRM2]